MRCRRFGHRTRQPFPERLLPAPNRTNQRIKSTSSSSQTTGLKVTNGRTMEPRLVPIRIKVETPETVEQSSEAAELLSNYTISPLGSIMMAPYQSPVHRSFHQRRYLTVPLTLWSSPRPALANTAVRLTGATAPWWWSTVGTLTYKAMRIMYKTSWDPTVVCRPMRASPWGRFRPTRKSRTQRMQEKTNTHLLNRQKERRWHSLDTAQLLNGAWVKREQIRQKNKSPEKKASLKIVSSHVISPNKLRSSG